MLQHRLHAIDGQGDMVHDLRDAVFMRRPSFDADIERLPCAFVRVRGYLRAVKPEPPFSDTTLIADVIGIVKAGDDEVIAGQELLADFYRALEIPNDMCMWDQAAGKFLLASELLIIDAQLEDIQAPMKFDLVGVGVQCNFTQRYGDPNHVT